jgi:poly(3-hydroxybutyrate) depolymerase
MSADADAVGRLAEDSPVLVVAPLSGHHATLLRGTVATLLTRHTVYVPTGSTPGGAARQGAFTNDVDYVGAFIRHVGAERLHVLAVASRRFRCWRRRRWRRRQGGRSRA